MSESREPVVATVSELKPRMKNLTVRFKVLEKGEAREVASRKDGSTHRVMDAVVGDSTGIVTMPLWDDSIEKLESDKTYQLENGYTTLFQGHLRLNIGRYGVISESDEPIETVNTEVDMSEAEHERPERRHYYQGGRDSYGGGYGGSRSWRSQRGDRDRRTRGRRRRY
ncbi:MAG: single-stranded DNA-binding protein [Candidatus Thorarchaeota archaeon]|nr:MAG: single-stranded DNA-binding protein [Candidatus Thorarchaeota archaeon]